MAPEYSRKGIYSGKSDVFSFGSLLLEILSGKRNGTSYSSRYARKSLSLHEYVCRNTIQSITVYAYAYSKKIVLGKFVGDQVRNFTYTMYLICFSIFIAMQHAFFAKMGARGNPWAPKSRLYYYQLATANWYYIYTC